MPILDVTISSNIPFSTINQVDGSTLYPLESITRTAFYTYRTQLDSVSVKQVQNDGPVDVTLATPALITEEEAGAMIGNVLSGYYDYQFA